MDFARVVTKLLCSYKILSSKQAMSDKNIVERMMQGIPTAPFVSQDHFSVLALFQELIKRKSSLLLS